MLLVGYGDDQAPQRFRIRPPGGLLNDNEWHDVVIVRDGQKVRGAERMEGGGGGKGEIGTR